MQDALITPRRFPPTLLPIIFGCLTVLLGNTNFSDAQESPPISTDAQDVSPTVVDRIGEDLKFIASDELQGRDSGSPGIRKAAEFIASRFEALGLKTDTFEGSPFQNFQLPGPVGVSSPEQNRLSVDGIPNPVAPELGKNFQPVSLGSNGVFEGELVFAGYGISASELDYDDYADIDVRGKVVIVLRKEPQASDPSSRFDGVANTQHAYFSTKELNASQHGAAALILVNDRATAALGDEDQLLDVTGAGSARSESKIPTIFCTRSLIESWLTHSIGKTLTELEEAIDTSGAPASQVLGNLLAAGEVQLVASQLEVRNIIGVLPGRGTLADQYVVLGAHYDHVGMGGFGSLAPGTIEVHNGADDNGSGTVAMLEVARRLSIDTSENRRTILFMSFTGEEKGLLGSKHYVRNPRWALETTVAMVNLDMVGRLTENALTVFGTGTAVEFSSLIDRMNAEHQFVINKQAAGFGPSDHTSFYEKGIPAFHFFTGLHRNYHRPSDDFETVNLEGIARISSLVTDLVRDLATAPQRPQYLSNRSRAVVSYIPSEIEDMNRKAALGIQVDLTASRLTVGSTDDGGAARKAGILPGDIILKVQDAAVENLDRLRDELAKKKPGEKARLTIERAGNQQTLEVVLGAS